jgi:putative transposase
MVYVDLNMVRAASVPHPWEWPFCGYIEIQNPGQRNSLVDHESLNGLFGIGSIDEFNGTYRSWVSEGLEKQEYRERHSRWTESIAIGREDFVRDVKEELGAKVRWREILGANGSYGL